ncbi:hypothetical protein FIBSPDRAFT_1053027 [Athelia psychrophila]|uniref:Uncharacterized protein n=1 Tax=Athelia psychrophila TaxID=1759441 RepID=A0A167XLM7_9AGAM|nr:hypothetical protein FIBSPDRAFT_1053027 [Fibularhizoctonia sp. CBS 109695]
MAFAARKPQQNTRGRLGASRLDASTAPAEAAPKKPKAVLVLSSAGAATALSASRAAGTSARAKHTARDRGPPAAGAVPKPETSAKARPFSGSSAPPIATAKHASSTSIKPPPSAAAPRTQPAAALLAPHTADPLQLAAQLYPWLYMTSHLEAAFQTSELSALNALDKRAFELADEESGIADQRVRFDAERRVACLDEIAAIKELPELVQTFLRNGIACEAVAAEVLHIHGRTRMDHPRSPFQVFDEILARIASAQTDADRLHAAFTRLLGSKDLAAKSSLSSFLHPIFEAFLPVMHVRISNLAAVHELVLCSKTNLGMALHIQSLKLTS